MYHTLNGRVWALNLDAGRGILKEGALGVAGDQLPECLKG
jgi:hypothetical protein